MTVLIAGAGIAGLSLGLSLHQLGIPFRIHEAVRELSPLGVGINIQPHAVRELFDLGLEAGLREIGIPIEGVAYFSAQGGAIWQEPRGRRAGYSWPQFAVHRGRLQMMLLEALRERAGTEVVRTGEMVADWRGEGGEVIARLVDRKTGAALGESRGSVLVAADGINSAIRARLFPDEGPARWRGVMMWRGVSAAPRFLGGRTMAMAGHRGQKFVCYPIADTADGRALVNWIADLALDGSLPEVQDWNRAAAAAEILPAFENWRFDWLDVPALVRAAEGVWKFPMVDRDPLARWTHGAVTLMGDAAHPMYPIGSNGASQAIIDARVLAREMGRWGAAPIALRAYEDERRPVTNAIVLMNRRDGPDRVLDVVAARAPAGFADISEVMRADELQAIADRYKAVAGFDVETLNARAPIIGPIGDATTGRAGK
ncbi:MAG: flavin-dependent oxidoreductase [Alphaproteobacteria bacterium]|nr:MAG: flavin-dependent oxidoreductase [Alphaproteobacteria bacterium]